VRFDLPDTSGRRSIVVTHQYGDGIKVVAFSVDPFTRADLLPVIDPFEGSASISVAMFEAPLADLLLVEGRLEYETDPSRAIPIPAADAYFEQEVTEEGPQGWEEKSAASEALEQFRYRSPIELCRRFRATELSIGLQAGPLMSAGERVIVGEPRAEELYRADEDGAERIAGELPGAPISGYRSPDGEIFLGSHLGRVFRGAEGRAFTAMPPAPTQEAIAWLAGPTRPGVPFELYALTFDSGFFRFTEERGWVELEQGTLAPKFSHDGGLVWIDPGHAIAFPTQDTSIDHYYFEQDGEVTRERTFASGSLGPITALGVVGESVLGITKLSNVVRFDENGNHEKIGEAAVLNDPGGLIAFEDGFLYVGTGGVFVQWRPRIGYCPEQYVESRIEVTDMVPYKDGAAVIGLDQELLLVRPLPPE
jgi:hypothetical protein